jgi:hypothetical protein
LGRKPKENKAFPAQEGIPVRRRRKKMTFATTRPAAFSLMLEGIEVVATIGPP